MWKAVIVLLISITLFSLIAEEMIKVPAWAFPPNSSPLTRIPSEPPFPYKAIEPTLDAIGIEQAFAGATVMALVPSSAEVRGRIIVASLSFGQFHFFKKPHDTHTHTHAHDTNAVCERDHVRHAQQRGAFA